MEKCVNLFDSYKDRGGLKTLAEFHAQEKFEKRFKIPLSTFSRYATINKSRRLPTSSYTGPRSEKFLNTCYERTSGTPPLSELSEEELALREKELDGQEACLVHGEMEGNEGFFDGEDDMSLGLARRGPVEDPTLDKFERWKMYEQLHGLEWWLRYYSYDARCKDKNLPRS